MKVQIRYQNVRIKVFDSSLTEVNKFMNKHLVYKKTMSSWSLLDWWWSLKIICNLSLKCSIKHLNHPILFSDVEAMAPTSSKGVFHLKYILTTHLSFLTFVLLPHVSHPQLYPILFAQSSHLLMSIGGPTGPSTTLSHKIFYFGKLRKFQGFFFCDGPIELDHY